MTASVEQQVAEIDGRLARIAATLREAHGHNELALVAELEERSDRLLDERNRLVPQQRERAE